MCANFVWPEQSDSATTVSTSSTSVARRTIALTRTSNIAAAEPRQYFWRPWPLFDQVEPVPGELLEEIRVQHEVLIDLWLELNDDA